MINFNIDNSNNKHEQVECIGKNIWRIYFSENEVLDDTTQITTYTTKYIELRSQDRPDPTDTIKKIVLDELDKYDKSAFINTFTLGSITGWLDKSTRVGLINSLSIQQKNGITESEIWIGNQKIETTPTQAIEYLEKIELYAQKCYIQTMNHTLNINNLNTIPDLISYDYTANYPEKLVL